MGGARISDDAIQRDRVSSRTRYHRNKELNRKKQKVYRDAKFEEREFIGWDGEGYRYFEVDSKGECEQIHAYMLFGASTGDCITGRWLGTGECLELICRVKRENRDTYFVGFSFEYDINMILKDLPWQTLAILNAFGRCRFVDRSTGIRYRIEHVPHKWLRVSDGTVSATIYDTFGFFHCGYLAALKKYGVGSEAKLAHIERGKAGRSNFTYAQIEEVKSYWLDEISLLPPLMECIRTAVYSGGYRVVDWHGPGALAAYLLRTSGVREWQSKKTPPEVKYAIRAAYAGGRFTLSLCGLFYGDIYTADINSAYVYAISLLPRMDRGKWIRQSPGDVEKSGLERFGLYRIQFDLGREQYHQARKRGVPEPPYPLFHRDKMGTLRWPRKTEGWYWTPEAELVMGSKNARILEAWVFDDNGAYPFRFVHDIFARRLEFQQNGNPAEKAYKWSLAAMYGAFARRVGWNKKTRKAPPSHELAWAGYITSWCRAAVWRPAWKAFWDGKAKGLISIDTDGITTTVPISESELCNGVGENLGQWKLEHYTGILAWQNGIYWLRKMDGTWTEPKSRGIPKGTIPFDAAFEALAKMDYNKRPFVHPTITVVRTRFLGYRQALRGQFKKWQRWLSEPVKITMGGSPAGKAFHFFVNCAECRQPTGNGLHTITATVGRESQSQPHKLPWLEDQPDLPDGFIQDEFKFIVRDEDIA
jgi:DNA polymerase family B